MADPREAMIRATRRRAWSRAAIALAFVVTTAVAGIANARDGGVSCVSSADCAQPTPHCQLKSHTCVGCLSNRNCPSSGVCDLATGTCKECFSDADCSTDRPYCDVSSGRCVECTTDANCGDLGLSCANGACGSCGDGICAPGEVIYLLGDHQGFLPQNPDDKRIACVSDCGGQCPTKDLGSSLGKFSVDGKGLRNLYSTTCDGVDGVDATFAWTAPRADTFLFMGTGNVTVFEDGTCAGGSGANGCYSGSVVDSGVGGDATIGANVTLTEGQHVIVVVDTNALHIGSIALEISKGTPPCGLLGCPTAPPPDAGTKAPSDEETTACLNDAKARGGEVCDGLECVCQHCPAVYGDCAKTAGCDDVRRCMQAEKCVATGCYNSGVCRSLIDSLGGVSSDAFRASAGVQSCELTFACALPCGTGGDNDASKTEPDAGRLCEPGRKVACPCEGGVGRKVCAADGNHYEACSCGGAPEPALSGCDCAIGRARSTGSTGFGFAVVLTGAWAGLRRRTRRRASARQAFLVALFAAFALMFARGARANDGGKSCSSSSDCRAPTPHCSATSHTCVECSTDSNCPANTVCDTATGSCKGCLTEADCPNDKPYCDTSKGECTECVTDVNCGGTGLACVDGHCGSCGDDICAPREGLYFDPTFSSSGQIIPAARTACIADCGKYCPTKDVGGTLGTFSVSGAGLQNEIETGCDNGLDGVEATFAWKAPRRDTFAFSSVGNSIVIFEGGCAALQVYNCSFVVSPDGGPARVEVDMNLKEGEEVLIAVDSGLASVASIELEIAKGTPSCGLFGCPAQGPQSDAGSDSATEQATAFCSANAEARHDGHCAGVDCACRHCPRDYDDCAVIPGCRDVERCMEEKGCVGSACYASGACRNVIDTYGGVSGAVFGAASRLQSCEHTFDCQLPCDAADAGDASTDGGHSCTPGQTVECNCADLAGRKTCSADGGDYGACQCDAASDGSGCDCRVVRHRAIGESGTATPFVLAGLSAIAFRIRKRDRSRKGAS